MFLFSVGSTPKRYLSFLIAIVCCVFFYGCDNGPQTDNSKKTLNFQLIWQERNTTPVAAKAAREDDVCSEYRIESIRARLYDANDALILSNDENPWECEDHEGTLQAPYGSGYRVVIQGLVAGQALWEGQADGIDVIEGVPNDLIQIEMSYIDSDRPPVIQSVSPIHETTVVSLTPEIRAVFDQPMNRQTMTATNIILYDSGDNAVAGQVAYDAPEQAVSFTPASLLLASSTYTVAISANVTNISGIPMGENYTWQFTTAGSSLDLIQPQNKADIPCDDVQFQWSEVDGAVSYHLQVASDSEFQQIMTDTLVQGTQFQLAQAVIGANYWRVQAQDQSQNIGAWSAVWQFNGRRTHWLQRFGSPGEDDAYGLAITQDNGIVVTGRTYGIISLPGSDDTYDYQGGGGDAFLCKLDESGNGVWLENLGTDVADCAYAVATDANDDIYITGFSEGDLDENKPTQDSQILLSKFSSNGNHRWTRQFGETTSDNSRGISTRSVNDSVLILVTGYISPRGEDIFVARYDSYGEQIPWYDSSGKEVPWIVDGTEGRDRGYSVLWDSDGNTIITGGENGRLNVFSYNAEAERIWKVDELGAVPDGDPYVKGAIYDDNIYVTGTLRNEPSADRISFVAKIGAADGQQKWKHLFQITEDIWYENGHNVAVDKDGNIYVAGIYYVADSRRAAYVCKFEPENGNLLWTETHGEETDTWQYDPTDIKVDSQGDLIITGISFKDANSYGSYEIFVWKLSGRDQ